VSPLVPPGHTHIRENILDKGNIPGVEGDSSAWAKGLNLPREGETVFFAGCGYQSMKYAEGMLRAARGLEKAGVGMEKSLRMSKAFRKVGVDLPSITARVSRVTVRDRYTKVLSRSVKILQKLGLDVAYMYEKEPCCGSPLYYAGFVDEYRARANENFQKFKSAGIKKIIGIIPACTASLRDIYPRYVKGYDLEVEHFVKVVSENMGAHKPRLKKNTVVAYHDPCQLSRYLGLVEEPREVLRQIEGLELREPDSEKRGTWSTCCGGGGLEAGNPKLAQRLGIRRMEELMKTEPAVILSHCPACVMQLRGAAKALGAGVKVMDFVDLLWESLEDS
jgi:Fe-S oxidoreductase